jgi:hypothetical protein
VKQVIAAISGTSSADFVKRFILVLVPVGFATFIIRAKDFGSSAEVAFEQEFFRSIPSIFRAMTFDKKTSDDSPSCHG